MERESRFSFGHREEPMKVYRGYTEDDGSAMGETAYFVQRDGEDPYKLEHRVRHSPDGMAHGYGGSGPADLSRSILWDHLGYEPPPGLYQDFKWEHVARWEQSKPWSITEGEINGWLDQGDRRQQLEEHLAWEQEKEELRRLSELERESE
jgi:hypothetical protein